jgi:hypothetical protein
MTMNTAFQIAILGSMRTTGGAAVPQWTPYVALWTGSEPNDAGSGGAEVSGSTGYARQVFTTASVASGSPSALLNTSAISFPTFTSLPGTIGWVCIFDDPAAGTMRYHGALDNARTPAVNDRVEFLTGTLSVRQA